MSKIKVFVLRLAQDKRIREVFLYLLFGVLTTVVNIASFYLLDKVLGLHYLLSNTIAFVLSVLFAYITNRKYVFKAAATGVKAIVKEITAFFGFRLLSFACDTLIMYLGIDVFHADELIIKIFANIFVIVFNYAASKLFIFKK